MYTILFAIAYLYNYDVHYYMMYIIYVHLVIIKNKYIYLYKIPTTFPVFFPDCSEIPDRKIIH